LPFNLHGPLYLIPFASVPVFLMAQPCLTCKWKVSSFPTPPSPVFFLSFPYYSHGLLSNFSFSYSFLALFEGDLGPPNFLDFFVIAPALDPTFADKVDLFSFPSRLLFLRYLATIPSSLFRRTPDLFLYFRSPPQFQGVFELLPVRFGFHGVPTSFFDTLTRLVCSTRDFLPF